MKKLFFLPIVAVFVLTQACNNTTETKDDTKSGDIETVKTTDSKGAIHLTKAEFLSKVANYETNPQEWVYLGDKPCIIDFYADWCAPCKIAGPILDELANEYKDDIYVYKIDTEQERELAQAFGIQSIPAFLFCPQNGNPQMSNGIAQTPEDTKAMFKQVIDEFLLEKKTATN